MPGPDSLGSANNRAPNATIWIARVWDVRVPRGVSHTGLNAALSYTDAASSRHKWIPGAALTPRATPSAATACRDGLR